MGLLVQAIILSVVAGGTVGLYIVYEMVIRQMLSPMSKLPGPSSESFLFGHAIKVHLGSALPYWKKWGEDYGPVYLLQGPLATRYIINSDLRAVKDMLMRTTDYVKPYPARTTLSMAIGAGLVVTEGEVHKKQRKLLNICFYPATIKALAPVFHEQSQELRDVFLKAVKNSSDQQPVLDVYHMYLATVLNMIGQAGFDYRFDAHNVNKNPNELYDALMAIYLFDPHNRYMSLLRLAFPDLHRIPSARKSRYQQGIRTFKRVTSVMLEDRKKAMFKAISPISDDKKFFPDECLSPVEKNYLKGRDLLSALVKANADPAIPNDQRMSDEEVLAQIKTFLVTGHETTGTALAWLTYELACNPAVQSKLREEIVAFNICQVESGDSDQEKASMDDINALPYLDAVLREGMRLRPAIPYTMRVAQKDDIVPLARGYTDKNGKWCDSLHVRKGDNFLIPIEGMNRSTELWGQDADEFKPERWTGGLDTGIPGVWSSMMTFLGGTRACIGYRFAIYEMKTILLTLLPVLEFSLAVPADDYAGMTCISKHPYAKSQLKAGFQMPIRVTQYVAPNEGLKSPI